MEKETKAKTNTVFNKAMLVPPDTKYLYYPYVESVTQNGSFLPAFII